MQSVEPNLLGRRRHEAQPYLPLVPREPRAVVLVDDLPSEQLSPEPGHWPRLPSIEGDCYETGTHPLDAPSDWEPGHWVSCGRSTAPRGCAPIRPDSSSSRPPPPGSPRGS